MSLSKQVVSNNIHEIDQNVMAVLKETLYPGAKDESIKMVMNYCKARKLDPLTKPVHLVPMSVKTGIKDRNDKDVYEFRDVVMPGIALYRIDACRSGQYAGMSEPEFGEDVTETLGQASVTYPKWCKISVKKIINNQVFEFTSKEYWKENYATAGRNDMSPNAMWKKRPYGQLAKCAEAQALRKAFPDILGQEYTAEEMEGKSFQDDPKSLKHIRSVESIRIPEPNNILESETDHQELQKCAINFIFDIKNCQTLDELRNKFEEVYKSGFDRSSDFFKKIVAEKDIRKEQLMNEQLSEDEYQETDDTDQETGEILQ